MKKIPILVLAFMLTLSLISCGKNQEVDKPANEEKDISVLLESIGKTIASVEKLGDLPEPDVSGLSMMYYTKDIQGFFSGFNMGIQIADDMKTVKQIYIKPTTIHVKLNGLLIGSTIKEVEELFGEGELNSPKSEDKSYYITYMDENYSMRCTVERDVVIAVAFERLERLEPDEENGSEDEEIFIGEYRNMDNVLVGLLGTKLNALEGIRKELPILERVDGFDFQEPVGKEGYNIVYWVDKSKVDGTTHHINKVALVMNYNYDDEKDKYMTMSVKLNMPIREARDTLVDTPSVKDPSKPETHRLKTDYGDLDDDGYVDIIYIGYR